VLGVLAATRRDTWLTTRQIPGHPRQALPGFWVAIVAIYIFSVQFRCAADLRVWEPRELRRYRF